MKRLSIKDQETRFSSPWTIKERSKVFLWHFVWLILFRTSPKYFYRWRNILLRIFGAKISSTSYVAPSAIIKMPWNLKMENRACIGPNAEAYNLAPLILRENSVVAQHVYLCGGTHDFSQKNWPLSVGIIEIGKNSFVGVRALILPGVLIGDNSIVGAGSVLTTDVEQNSIVAVLWQF